MVIAGKPGAADLRKDFLDGTTQGVLDQNIVSQQVFRHRVQSNLAWNLISEKHISGSGSKPKGPLSKDSGFLAAAATF